jgi:hypothetical protein
VDHQFDRGMDVITFPVPSTNPGLAGLLNAPSRPRRLDAELNPSSSPSSYREARHNRSLSFGVSILPVNLFVLLICRADVGPFVYTHVGGVIGVEDVGVGPLDASGPDLLVVHVEGGRAALASIPVVVFPLHELRHSDEFPFTRRLVTQQGSFKSLATALLIHTEELEESWEECTVHEHGDAPIQS